MSTKIIVVRHGEAAGNCERYFQGHSDGAVSEKGMKQLEALAKRFEQIHLDAIYSSPLSRAKMTAEAMNRRLGLPIATDERLIEINGGVLEGVKWKDLPVLFPEQAELWSLKPYLFHPEGGESMDEVRARMSAAIMDIAEENDGGTVAVTSHGCAIRALICWAKGWPRERLNEVDWWDNTALGIIEMNGGVPTLLSENDCSHITGELSTFANQRWWRKPDEMVYDD